MENSLELQKEGLRILEFTNLLSRLDEVGESHLVGNMAFETTIKPDIDIQVYPNENLEIASERVVEILNSICAKDIIVRKLRISKKTLILSKFDYNGKIWNIDIALTNESNDYLYDSYKYFLDNQRKFTDENRKLVIKFKEKFCKDRLIFDNPSFYIYRGVLEKGINTEQEMKDYLKETERQLKREKR